jgi:hypothetical protein
VKEFLECQLEVKMLVHGLWLEDLF